MPPVAAAVGVVRCDSSLLGSSTGHETFGTEPWCSSEEELSTGAETGSVVTGDPEASTAGRASAWVGIGGSQRPILQGAAERQGLGHLETCYPQGMGNPGMEMVQGISLGYLLIYPPQIATVMELISFCSKYNPLSHTKSLGESQEWNMVFQGNIWSRVKAFKKKNMDLLILATERIFFT